ncbi:MAG: hypothetical protein HZB25_14035 [Candidatus Eisenbacteria bacterium]|nr:hypothetical protein [Candidatus Eisenbacteria bacterium]
MATKKTDVREHARELAKLGARKGGHARAAVLTAPERREIARKAVLVRWRKQKGESYQPPQDPGPARAPASDDGHPSSRVGGIPRSLFQGKLLVGHLQIECHVLSDGTRIFAPAEASAPVHGVPGLVNLRTLLARVPPSPERPGAVPEVTFMVPGGQSPSRGYEASYLVEVAAAYVDARDEGRLKADQESLAKHADAITRSLARLGIVAQIDAATGFEQVRLKRMLQLELQAFIARDLQEWALTFPEEFWSELARLEGIRYAPRSRPLRWGSYVMLFVYDAIDQDVQSRLKVSRPDLHVRADHLRWLEEFSKEHLNRHLRKVAETMSQCRNLAEFQSKMDRVFRRDFAEVGSTSAE